MSNEKKEKPWHKKGSWIVGIIACYFVFGSFGFYWIYLPNPHDVNNKQYIEISGTFGDSFGFLTCLFSGLSSIGMIVAILMQREELKENRNAFIDQKITQENNVKLSALMIIHKEEEKEIDYNQKIINECDDKKTYGELERFADETGEEEFAYYMQSYKRAKKRQLILYDRREMIFSEIEKIIIESGVNLPLLPK